MAETWGKLMSGLTINFGSNMFFGIFFIAIFYLLITEKKHKVLTYYGIASLLIVFNPLIANSLVTFYFHTWDNYWLVFGICPVLLICSYVMAKLIGDSKLRKQKVLLFALTIGIMAFCGSFLYTKDNFKLSDNKYRIPQEVAEVADILEREGGYIKIIAPDEIVEHIRKYSSDVRLLYGKEVLSEDFEKSQDPADQLVNRIYRDFNNADISVSVIVDYAKQFGCRYLVFEAESNNQQQLKKLGFDLLDRTSTYEIYKDVGVEE